MDTNRLADILRYRITEHLGIEADYRATVLPDVRGLQVVMIRPEHLRGFTFQFNEDQPLPPQILAGRGEPRDTVRYTLQADHVANPPNIRTIEQEARYQEILAMDADEHNAQVRGEYALLNNLLPNPTPPQPRIRVRVHRDTYENWQVIVKVGNVNRDLPPIAVIKALLPPADKHYIPSRQGRYRSTLAILRNSLSAGLPAQSLHDALRAWIMATENMVTNAESTMPANGIDQATANLLRAQPATLEVGGLVYRLVPCHQTDVRPLISRVRTKALASAQVEATGIRERAVTDARVTVTEAERGAARIREAIRIAEREAGVKIPDWVRVSKRPHYWDGSSWRVEMRVSCYLRDIRLTIPVWATILHWTPLRVNPADHYVYHKMPVWFRLYPDGACEMDSICVKEYMTTHISGRACMTLDGIPTRINSLESLRQLEVAVERGMNVVNLNSPLNTEVSNYYPDFKAQLPDVVVKILRDEISISPGDMTIAQFRERYPQITWDSTETIQQEQEGTFSVDTPPVPVVQNAAAVTYAQVLAQARTAGLDLGQIDFATPPDVPIIVRRRRDA